MRVIGYLVIGIFFGIVMFKSEAASWFRIYEMFQFQSFHMYGIIGSALVIGILGIRLIKRKKLKDFNGEEIQFSPKDKSFSRYMFGGILFGLGWALAGACPGPIYTLIGAGYIPVIVVFLAAIFGTFVYGLLRNKLPH
ncbi:YeeE/YedE family protein [Christiangramia forsetii]|uniref:Membrane protein containing YeeE/YedE domain n=2 Tax=Christiangramia forsetii TaxID=411153 RepID=A0M008_CHRFK|nr:DUF6691 family protein [Christiangramia forsetii]GGG45802.1 transporter [Christiangramia forsetii]CAL65953.1 membrane protein containing YeeE/YedE domain [Christiangramia forsetii KT0803]